MRSSPLRVRAVIAVLLTGAFAVPRSLMADDARPETPGTTQFVVCGYLPWYRIEDWSPESIGPVTDLMFFGVRLHRDGRLDDETLTAEAVSRLTAARSENGCRVLLCVGGGGRSNGFAAAVASAAARERLSGALADLCRTRGFDGIDFDWEYPEGERQLGEFAQLLAETKRRLGEQGIVTVAQSPWRDFGAEVYRAVDRVHVMSYNHRHPQARFEDSRSDVERMIAYGCPAEKLVLGVPFYGRNADGRTKTFRELAGAGRLDPRADVLQGYAFNGRETVRAKTRYALEEGLGGIMIWELGQDASQPGVSLLRGIELELREHADGETRSSAD